MHDISLSQKTNTARLSGFIENRSVDTLRPEKRKSARPVDPQRFSEVFKGISDAIEINRSKSRERTRTELKERRSDKSDEFEKERVESSSVRQDIAPPQGASRVIHKGDEVMRSEASSSEAAAKSGDGQLISEIKPSASDQNTKETPTALSEIKQDAASPVLNTNTSPLGQSLETDLISALAKDSIDPPQSSLKKSEVAESAETAVMNLVEKSDAVPGEVDEKSKVDLKAVLAKELLAKQSPLAQRSAEKQLVSDELRPGVTSKASTSIIESVQGGSLTPSTVSEGGQEGSLGQGGRGQGGTSFGNTGFAPVSDLLGTEGPSATQKTATDFRTLLEAGRAIPDEGGVLRQVADQLRTWRAGQDEPIRFLLEPKNLGMIQIDVMLKEGGLRAHMVTADPAVKALLETNQQFLQDALRDQGLQMEQFSVDLGDRKGFMNDTQNPGYFKNSGRFSEKGDVAERVKPLLSPIKSGPGGLSLYV